MRARTDVKQEAVEDTFESKYNHTREGLSLAIPIDSSTSSSSSSRMQCTRKRRIYPSTLLPSILQCDFLLFFISSSLFHYRIDIIYCTYTYNVCIYIYLYTNTSVQFLVWSENVLQLYIQLSHYSVLLLSMLFRPFAICITTTTSLAASSWAHTIVLSNSIHFLSSSIFSLELTVFSSFLSLFLFLYIF